MFFMLLFIEKVIVVLLLLLLLLVLPIECEFVHIHRKLTSDMIQFVVIQLSIPNLVKRTLHERIAGSATFDHDLFQIGPLDFVYFVFNLHAYSVQARPTTVKIFCTLFFTFFHFFSERQPGVYA